MQLFHKSDDVLPCLNGKGRLSWILFAAILLKALTADSDDNIFKGGDEVIQKVTKSLVSIYAKPTGDRITVQGPVKRSGSTGTGFFINNKGDIATAYHVVDHCEKVSVKLSDQKQYEAVVVGFDPYIDVALLKLKGPLPAGLAHLDWVENQDLKVGQKVIIAGDPGGLRTTFTAGIISTLHRTIQLWPVEDFIQTDAPVNPGNSGGPTLNRDGLVVGILSAGSPSMKGVGFAVPQNLAKRSLEKISQGTRWEYHYLGIAAVEENPFTKELGHQTGAGQGLLIMGVVEKSAAQEGDIRYGDVWIGVGETPIRSFTDAFSVMDSKKTGDTLEIKLIRNTQPVTVTLTPRSRPLTPQFGIENFARVHLGFEIQKAPPSNEPNQPLFRIGKVFSYAEDKKDRLIKEGQWLLQMQPARSGGIPETILDNEQFTTLVYGFSLIDDGTRFSIGFKLADDLKDKGKWINSTRNAIPTLF